MNLSVVIPIYNCRDVIEKNVNDLIGVLDSLNINYEILLRDDKSTDQPQKILDGLTKKSPRIKIFYNDRNYGLGYTLRSLASDARGDYIIYCDCDLPFGAGALPGLLKCAEEGALVVLSRYRGAVARSIPWARRVSSRAYYLICKIFFNIDVVDAGSGTVLFPKGFFEKVELESDGFDIHIEIFAKAKRAGFKIIETPGVMVGKQIHTFEVFRHGPGVFLRTIILWWKLLLRR